ncbi:MAG: HEAT repeat domain-containing protein [Thermodesulfobacteriota bacterium]|nr:HEAT repeat domain-containing protein [Thermodesulfobacteriota bacterium]
MTKRYFIFAGLILALVAYALVSRGYVGSLIHPLPFGGPYSGTVLDASNGKPIKGATVQAAWWCYDFPYPHIGEYWVYAVATTDEKGRYEIQKPRRRGGWFGGSFTLMSNAKGYIRSVFALEPSGRPLPASTKEYPFIDTRTDVSLPAKLDIRLNPARPVLLKALKSKKAQYRQTAADELGNIGEDARYAVDALIQGLKDEDNNVRKYTAKALGKIGPAAIDAVPELLTLLEDEDKWVRLEAIDALGAIGHGGEGSVVALTDLIDDEEKVIRTHAVRSLSKLGPRAKAAVPALKKILGQSPINKYFRNEVEYALEKIDTD